MTKPIVRPGGNAQSDVWDPTGRLAPCAAPMRAGLPPAGCRNYLRQESFMMAVREPTARQKPGPAYVRLTAIGVSRTLFESLPAGAHSFSEQPHSCACLLTGLGRWRAIHP